MSNFQNIEPFIRLGLYSDFTPILKTLFLADIRNFYDLIWVFYFFFPWSFSPSFSFLFFVGTGLDDTKIISPNILILPIIFFIKVSQYY